MAAHLDWAAVAPSLPSHAPIVGLPQTAADFANAFLVSEAELLIIFHSKIRLQAGSLSKNRGNCIENN